MMRLRVAAPRSRTADDPAGRHAGRALDRQRSVRTAVQSARDEPEHHPREPADDVPQRHRDDADDQLRRPARAAGSGPRNGRRSAQREPRHRANWTIRCSRQPEAELPVQQSELLVSAGDRRATTPPRRFTSPCPHRYGCVASGELSRIRRQRCRPRTRRRARKLYHIHGRAAAAVPRVLVSRFDARRSVDVAFADTPAAQRRNGVAAASAATRYSKLDLIVEANPRQSRRGRELAERAVDIVQFYESILGDSPYSELHARARRERLCPAATAPATSRVLNQPLPRYAGLRGATIRRRSTTIPEFFLAHEIAHQWWGQAVGWRNYHEQWLSEGFAQYFAALYAQQLPRRRRRSPACCGRCAAGRSTSPDQGPSISAIASATSAATSRVFRALVYNKGAAVLHMLRRLVGDEAFFRGLRRFYASRGSARSAPTTSGRRWKRNRAGRSSGSSSAGSTAPPLPQLTFSYRVESAPTDRRRCFTSSRSASVFDLPVTVTLQYADRKSGRRRRSRHRPGRRAARAARRRRCAARDRSDDQRRDDVAARLANRRSSNPRPQSAIVNPES